jgi:hypothetical protein
MPGPGLLVERKPLEELGPHFLQRVFTRKVRKVGNEKKPLRLACPPEIHPSRGRGRPCPCSHHDPPLTPARTHPTVRENDKPPITPHQRATALINGEALEQPYVADLFAGAVETTDKTAVGKFERVDPIDAAIAVTSDYGIDPAKPQVIADPRQATPHGGDKRPQPVGRTLAPNEVADVEAISTRARPKATGSSSPWPPRPAMEASSSSQRNPQRSPPAPPAGNQRPLLPRRHLGQQGQPRQRHRLRHRRRPRPRGD